jgi:hypothetical protein
LRGSQQVDRTVELGDTDKKGMSRDKSTLKSRRLARTQKYRTVAMNTALLLIV